MRRTKIVATLGPASNSPATIRDLIAAGVDIFRLNFSHGTPDEHAAVLARVRDAERASGRCIAVLQDLSGPKIRTGRLRNGEPIELAAGSELRIVVGEAMGEPGMVSTTFADLPRAVHPGDTLLLDDGHIELRVVGATASEVRTTVVDGGKLGEHKGINAPGVTLPTSGFTAKDADDLRFGVAHGVDAIALSFVQGPDDLVHAREALRAAGAPRLPLVAKLERPQALERLDDILHVSDAVMVARGDLGLEMPLERVPQAQKAITRRARALGVPVILATQVLESMRNEPRPTRAEVSDAAYAVDESVDAIMLAGETAAGSYPVRAVQVLDAIVRDAERVPPVGAIVLEDTHLLAGHGRALCEAAITLAERGDAAAIVAVTRGGKTARVLAALRPQVPVYAATDHPDIAHRLVWLRGVTPVVNGLSGDLGAAVGGIIDDLVAREAIARGASVVLVSITPDLAPGPSNFLRIQRA